MKKSNPCPQCNPCLNFCPSPKADGHHYSLIYLFRVAHGSIHSVLPLCPQPAAGTQIKKRNTDTTDFTRIGLSRISFFDIIWVNDVWIWVWFIWICECWHTPFPGILYTDFITKTRINSCMLLRALRLDSCHTGRPYESKLSTVNLHDSNRWRPQSPPSVEGCCARRELALERAGHATADKPQGS